MFLGCPLDSYVISKGILMVFLWNSYGVSKGCLSDFHSVPIRFLWDFYDISMGFLWDFHDISLNFGFL